MNDNGYILLLVDGRGAQVAGRWLPRVLFDSISAGQQAAQLARKSMASVVMLYHRTEIGRWLPGGDADLNTWGFCPFWVVTVPVSRLLCAQLTSDGHPARSFEESGLRLHPAVESLPGLPQLDGGPPSVFAPSSAWLAFRDRYRWDPTKLPWVSGADAVLAWREAYPPALRWWNHDIDYDNDSYSAIVLDDDGHIKMSRYLPLFSEAGAREEARIWSMDIGMTVQLFRRGVEIARFGCE